MAVWLQPCVLPPTPPHAADSVPWSQKTHSFPPARSLDLSVVQSSPAGPQPAIYVSVQTSDSAGTDTALVASCLTLTLSVCLHHLLSISRAFTRVTWTPPRRLRANDKVSPAQVDPLGVCLRHLIGLCLHPYLSVAVVLMALVI